MRGVVDGEDGETGRRKGVDGGVEGVAGVGRRKGEEGGGRGVGGIFEAVVVLLAL